MKTKIVYVLVSSDKDIYLEQLYVSMASARRIMQNARITVVTDKCTNDSLTGKRREEMKYVDELIVVDTDETKTGQYRSRILKTGLRNYVDGDFLFIDCDTIVVKPLGEIDEWRGEISACIDTHTDLKNNPYRNMIYRHARILGWDVSHEPEYFNSGVIFVRDCDKTRAFYKKWQDNYIKGTQVGVFMDQPSFAKTNFEMNHIVTRIPDKWNCELKHGIRYLKDALIVHYLCTNISNGSRQLFLLNERSELEKVKSTAEITDSIQSTFDDPFAGLDSLTTSFSSSDTDFLTTPQFKWLRKRYGKFDFRMMGVGVRVLSIMERIFKNLQEYILRRFRDNARHCRTIYNKDKKYQRGGESPL